MKWELISNYPDPGLEKRWFDFLEESNYPSHYTSPGFFLEPFWENKKPFAVLISEGEKLVGAATGLRQGKQIVSGLAVRPQLAVSKFADEKQVAKTLVEGLLAAAGDEAELLTLHSPERLEEFTEFGFREKRAIGGNEVVMLDLTAGAERVFKGFSQSRRSDLRKAMRENRVQISPLETVAELEELYPIHVEWCRRKKIEPDSREAMQKIFETRRFHRIFVAKSGGKIIAGSFFRFCPGGIVEYAANNSLPEHQHLRPNDLLVWKSIEWACAAGFTRYSMGGSHLFLRRFGGEITASYRYRLDRSFFRKHERKEAVMNFAVKTYQSLPDGARRRIKQLAGRG